jgi:hypothetical protein
MLRNSVHVYGQSGPAAGIAVQNRGSREHHQPGLSLLTNTWPGFSKFQCDIEWCMGDARLQRGPRYCADVSKGLLRLVL